MPNINDFKRIEPGGQISAADYNRHLEATQALSGLAVQGGVRSDVATVIHTPDPPTVEVLITGVDTSQAQARYSGIEQQRDDQGVPSNKPGGLTFAFDYLPLYERNNVSNVPTGKIVEARQGDGAFYLFTSTVGGASGTTVYVNERQPGTGYYSGNRQTYAAAVSSWVNGDAVWVFSNDAVEGAAGGFGELTSGLRYQCDQIGSLTLNGDARPLYVTDQSAPGGQCASYIQAGLMCIGAQDMPNGVKSFQAVAFQNENSFVINPGTGEVDQTLPDQSKMVHMDGTIWYDANENVTPAVIISAGGAGVGGFYGQADVVINGGLTFVTGGGLSSGRISTTNAGGVIFDVGGFGPGTPFSHYLYLEGIGTKNMYWTGQLYSELGYSTKDAASAGGGRVYGASFQDIYTGLRFRHGLCVGFGIGPNSANTLVPQNFPDNWLN